MDEATRMVSLPRVVDWLERSIVLRISAGGAGHYDYALDLLAFDFLLQASKGYLPPGFYSYDTRRIINLLAHIAEQDRGAIAGDISILVKGKSYRLTIDEGNVIQVSGEV